MTTLDNFLNSLSEKDKKLIKQNEDISKLETQINPEEKVNKTYEHILNLQVESGQMFESDKDQLLRELMDSPSREV